MTSNYHHTGGGVEYTINSDGTVTRHVNKEPNRKTSIRRHNTGHGGWWIFYGVILIIIIAIGVGINAYNENSYLYVSKSNISVSAEGETIYISVTSNRDWYISTRPAAWGHARIYGNTIKWEVEPNKGTNSRTDYIDLSCTNCLVRIHIEQAAKKYLTISQYEVDVSALGGSYSFTVSTNESWYISTDTYSWGHLVKKGNALFLTIDENPMTGDRDDYFVISSESGLERRVDIHQEGSYLFTDKDDLIFDYNGTSQTITVICGGTWDIDVGTRSWAHLSRYGNTLILSCDYNPGETRHDWFRLKSGSLIWRVDFKQN